MIPIHIGKTSHKSVRSVIPTHVGITLPTHINYVATIEVKVAMTVLCLWLAKKTKTFTLHE